MLDAMMITTNSRMTYSILDTDDQQKVLKECIKEMELNDKLFAPRLVQSSKLLNND